MMAATGDVALNSLGAGMKRLCLIALAAIYSVVYTNIADADQLNGKWICIVEKSAGVMIPSGQSSAVPSAFNFDEKHRRFVLSIRPIAYSELRTKWCLQTLRHWMPLLEKGGEYPHTLSNSSGNGSDAYDYRFNVGPQCFSSTKATSKFFDQDQSIDYYSYDFLDREFQGLPGAWLKFWDGKHFELAESLDAGPVVHTGNCERIEP